MGKSVDWSTNKKSNLFPKKILLNLFVAYFYLEGNTLAVISMLKKYLWYLNRLKKDVQMRT